MFLAPFPSCLLPNTALLGLGGCPWARRHVCGRPPTLAGSGLRADGGTLRGWLERLQPYLVPFFFKKVFLTLRWRLLSSKAANPPLSRVKVSSMLEMLLPAAGTGEWIQKFQERAQSQLVSLRVFTEFRPEAEPRPGLGLTRQSEAHGGRSRV